MVNFVVFFFFLFFFCVWKMLESDEKSWNLIDTSEYFMIEKFTLKAFQIDGTEKGDFSLKHRTIIKKFRLLLFPQFSMENFSALIKN